VAEFDGSKQEFAPSRPVAVKIAGVHVPIVPMYTL
jgi:hypothetical protein